MNISSYIYNKVSAQHCIYLQRKFFSLLYFSLFTLSLFTLAGCAIPDDIPYPIVKAEITAIEVEGMCDQSGSGVGTAIIDEPKNRIKIFVDDLVDIEHLKVTRMAVTNDALVIVNDTIYQTSDIYPKGDLPVQTHRDSFIVNGRHTIPITLRTWQDYKWNLEVIQVVNREVEVEGQVGDAIIDPVSRVCIIYVSSTQDLSKIKVKKFSLGGQHGSVSPDPTQQTSVDFSSNRIYYVTYGWSNRIYPWDVYVYTTQSIVEPTATATTSAKGAAIVSGSRPNGIVPVVEYKAVSDATWTTVAESDIKLPTSTTYEVEFKELHSDVQYTYRVSFGSKTINGQPFYFIGEQLENSSFDDWHITGEELRPLYQPWAEGGECYWDTGNKGATTASPSNSTYKDEDGRRYANLQSKFIAMKLAAGNIFTGEYLVTDGTNGVLSFGRPFSSRPAKFQFDYQYKTSTITKTGGNWEEAWGQYITRQLYEGLKGQPDSCSVYIALGDWEPVTYRNHQYPYLIRTRPSALHLMDMNDSHIIGLAQMTCGEDVNTWTTKTLNIEYRNERTPTTIIVVAASSKYGDYFTGGETSLLKIDELKLIY